jgi:hypothetical protein
MTDTTGSPAAAAPAPPLDVGRTRGRVLVFAIAVLVLQLVVPLTYYLRDDPYDERFAWRMFSAERLHTCTSTAVELVVDGGRKRVRRIPLDATLHVAWLTHIRRNRRPVVHRFLEWRCQQPGVSAVRLLNRCVAADRAPLAPRHYAIECADGDITERADPVPARAPASEARDPDVTDSDAPDDDAPGGGKP